MAEDFLGQNERKSPQTTLTTVARSQASSTLRTAAVASGDPDSKEEKASSHLTSHTTDLEDCSSQQKKLISAIIGIYHFDDEDDGLALSLLQQGVRFPHPIVFDDNYYSNASEIHCAYLGGGANSKTFQYLLNHPDIDLDATCDEGNEEGSHEDTLQFSQRLSPGDNGMRSYTDGYALEQATLLHLAVVKRDFNTVKQLCDTKRVKLDAKANLVQNKHLLGEYSVCDEDELGLREDGTELVDRVFFCRVSIEIIRTFDVTPLHLAARCSNAAIMKLLISAGADITAKDSTGRTAEDYFDATKSEKNTTEAVKAKYPEYNPGSYKFIEAVKNEDIAVVDALFKKLNVSAAKGKTRLLIGEANFSYPRALLDRHKATKPWLGASITATEYMSDVDLKRVHGDKFEKNIAALKNAGAAIIFNVDGTKIHTYQALRDKRYKRIHFNFPHDKSSFKDRTLPRLIANFFQSASHLQKINDEIHMALPNPPVGVQADRRFRQACVYGIFEASARAGYVLVKKRRFGAVRYPGYEHVITGRAHSVEVAENAPEFIFKKTDLSYEAILKHRNYGPGGWKYIYGEYLPYLKEIATDDDSSSYEDNSDEEIGEEKSAILNQEDSKRTESRAGLSSSGSKQPTSIIAATSSPNAPNKSRSPSNTPKKEDVKKESKEKKEIGLRTIPGWVLEDVDDEGNCFYDAVIHQMVLMEHSFLNGVPVGTEPRDSLRLHVQGVAFKDEEWADYREIQMSARKLNCIIAIIDTRDTTQRFVYHYINSNGNPASTTELSSITPERAIFRLAFTGNHYLSVVKTAHEVAAERLERDKNGSFFSTPISSSSRANSLSSSMSRVTAQRSPQSTPLPGDIHNTPATRTSTPSALLAQEDQTDSLTLSPMEIKAKLSPLIKLITPTPANIKTPNRNSLSSPSSSPRPLAENLGRSLSAVTSTNNSAVSATENVSLGYSLSPAYLQRRRTELVERKGVLEELIAKYTAELREVDRQSTEITEQMKASGLTVGTSIKTIVP